MNSLNVTSLNEALYDFLSEYLTPAVDKDYIFCGNQNNLALPPNCNDYVIYTVLTATRHGRNIEEYDPILEKLSHRQTVEYTVQVDCYTDTSSGVDAVNAMKRAMSAEILAISGIGQEICDKLGFHLLYAEPTSDSTIQDSSNQYLRRWTTTLHIATNLELILVMPGFTGVKVHNDHLTTRQQAQTQDPSLNVLGIKNVDLF